MIQTLIGRFDDVRNELIRIFRERHPNGYEDILQETVKLITSEDDYGDLNLDPDRIHRIDDGDYQGTLVFVIGAKGYQPNSYWYTKVSYGSCSGCDTFQSIRYDDYGDKPTDSQANDYFTLALHMVQRMRAMQD